MRRHVLIMQVAVCLIAQMLFSCTSSKKMVYLQGTEYFMSQPQHITEDYEFRIKVDDRLDVIVNSKEPELLTPFSNAQKLGSTGENRNSDMSSGLLVDKDGVIDIPVLGKMQAAGLTRRELAEVITQELIDGEYIKNPTVIVRFKGAKVLVLGEVNSPGVKSVENERVTILEALGMAGDLPPTARRDNILVVREENGERRSYTVDLTSGEDVFTSPVYYLQQNDIVYVEPNKSINVRGSSGLSFLSAIGSVVGVFSSIVALIILIAR